MFQASERLSFGEELIYILVLKCVVQDFERHTTFQVNMFSQVDLGETATSEQAQQAIVA